MLVCTSDLGGQFRYHILPHCPYKYVLTCQMTHHTCLSNHSLTEHNRICPYPSCRRLILHRQNLGETIVFHVHKLKLVEFLVFCAYCHLVKWKNDTSFVSICHLYHCVKWKNVTSYRIQEG